MSDTKKSPRKVAAASQNGVSLRDYFAGQALIGLFSRGERDVERKPEQEWFAKAAYALADEMVREATKVLDETAPG